MTAKKPSIIRPVDHTVRVRKAYFDCRFGQLHVRTAFSGSGGFDERTTLICIHPGGASGRVFDGLLPTLAADRSVYAPDLPGNGESDPAPQLNTENYATAICDFIESLRLRKVDLLACADAGVIAAEVAKKLPTVVNRRLDMQTREWETLSAQPQALSRRVREALG